MSIESAKLNAERAAWKALFDYADNHAVALRDALIDLSGVSTHSMIKTMIEAYHTALENAATVN